MPSSSSNSGRRWLLLAWAGLSGLIPAAFPSAPFAPNQLKELGLWLAAADLARTLGDGGAVTRWADLSGHGYDAVFEARVPQAGRAVGVHHPPRLQWIAGQPAVSFEAVGRQTLVLNMAGRALGQGVRGFTAAFVIRAGLAYPPAPAADMPWTPRRYLFISHLSDFSTRLSVQVIRDTGEVRLLSRTVPGAELQRVSSLAGGPRFVLRDGAWQRLIVSVDYTRKEARIYIDGTGLQQALAPGGPAAFEDLPSPVTGIASTTLGDWINGQVAEMICYERALEPDEIRTLDAYLCATHHLAP